MGDITLENKIAIITAASTANKLGIITEIIPQVDKPEFFLVIENI